MPRPAKRKADPPITSSGVDYSVRSAPGKATKKQLENIDRLFQKYANQSMSLIDPEGIEALCSDVKVDHTDVRILMLAWKMKAKKQGYFSKDEWQTGLESLGVDTVPKLKKALPRLKEEVMAPQNFEDFYSFAFKYCLTEEKQRSLDIETICELLNLVLRSQFHVQVDSLIEFLKMQNDYKALTMDQWIHFYRFFKETSFPDLQNYDSSQAWPVILDSFAEWLKAKQT